MGRHKVQTFRHKAKYLGEWEYKGQTQVPMWGAMVSQTWEHFLGHPIFVWIVKEIKNS